MQAEEARGALERRSIFDSALVAGGHAPTAPLPEAERVALEEAAAEGLKQQSMQTQSLSAFLSSFPSLKGQSGAASLGGGSGAELGARLGLPECERAEGAVAAGGSAAEPPRAPADAAVAAVAASAAAASAEAEAAICAESGAARRQAEAAAAAAAAAVAEAEAALTDEFGMLELPLPQETHGGRMSAGGGCPSPAAVLFDTLVEPGSEDEDGVEEGADDGSSSSSCSDGSCDLPGMSSSEDEAGAS
jgi:hypothetical protein